MVLSLFLHRRSIRKALEHKEKNRSAGSRLGRPSAGSGVDRRSSPTRSVEKGGVRGSVSRVLCLPQSRRRPFVWDARCRAPRATDPSGSRGNPRFALLAKSEAPLLLGLAPGGVCRAAAVAGARGALLPHRFTLARGPEGPGGRSVLCGTVPRVAPAGRYPAPCFRGARTFLRRSRRTRAAAAIRPSDASS